MLKQSTNSLVARKIGDLYLGQTRSGFVPTNSGREPVWINNHYINSKGTATKGQGLFYRTVQNLLWTGSDFVMTSIPATRWNRFIL